jgi:putative DNA-invertase from lambdoid prophage Rac
MMLTMLAAAAELERDLRVERAQAGLQRAKQQGKKLGRPVTTTVEQRADILARPKAGASISELSRLYGVSRVTIMRIATTKRVEVSIQILWRQSRQMSASLI